VIVDGYIKSIGSNLTITAVMNEDIPVDSLKLALKNIKSFYWVKNARLIKPDSGLTKIDNNIGGISEDLLPENPLPALINVTIKEKYLNSFNLAKYNLLLKRIDEVDSTILRKEYAETVFSIENQFNVLSIIIVIVLSLIILLIIFLSLNPEFVSSKSNVMFSSGIKDYSQSAKEIFSLLSIVVSGSIIISSGLIYLLWYLSKEELQWYLNTPWQILLWNLSFVLITFELVFLILYIVYKPKKSITNNELRPFDKAQGDMITNEALPHESIINEVADSSTSPHIKESITNDILPNKINENVEDDSSIVKVKDEAEDSFTAHNTTEEKDNTIETWEDDIT